MPNVAPKVGAFRFVFVPVSLQIQQGGAFNLDRPFKFIGIVICKYELGVVVQHGLQIVAPIPHVWQVNCVIASRDVIG